MTLPLSGKTALVTGASSGIGAAITRAFSSAGARVAAAARRADRLAAMAEERLGGEVIPLEVDLVDRAQCDGLTARAVERLGHIDILVNCAGMNARTSLADADLDAWRQMVELNLTCAIVLTHNVFAQMTKRQQGHIVNISSTAGRIPGSNWSGYAATKFGLSAFTEAFRREALKQKVRVTAIEPGGVATDLVKGPDLVGRPLLRPEDVAAAVLYAVTQPPHVAVNEIMLRPLEQEF